jgi:anti-sigma factor RsiW
MTCGRPGLLEAHTRSELTAVAASELEAHVATCARCRHELNWLRTERALFRARAGRDEVAHLWQGVAARTAPRPSRLSRFAVALAASALALLAMQQLVRAPIAATVDEPTQSEPFASEPIESTDPTACSRLPEGLGFRCTMSISDEALASR